MQSHLPTRRQALAFGASAGAVLLPQQVLSAAAPAAPLVPGNLACVLTPELEEGPYYFDPKLQRSDIREGHGGAPLRLILQIVDAGDCAPLAGARVDVWHCDAHGFYSGYEGQGDDELWENAQAHLAEDHPDLVGKVSREDILAQAEEL